MSRIPGWLSSREAKELHGLAAGRRCLEVGSYCGKSSVAIGTAAESLLCIDTFDGRSTPRPRNTLSEFRENLKPFDLIGNAVTYFPATIEDWAKIASVKSFDLIFLDTDHTAEAVTAHLHLLAPFMSPAGVVAVHDYGNPDFPGVAVACESFFQRTPDRVTDHLAVYLMDGPPAGRVLNVVTPLSRPDSIPALGGTIGELGAALPGWAIHWHISCDRRIDYLPPLSSFRCVQSLTRQPAGGGYGNTGRSQALDMIRAGWVCFLDDDNAFHPDFAPGLLKAVREYPNACGFVFDQVKADGTKRLDANPRAGPGQVDTAQFVFRRSLIGSHRWDMHSYGADYLFFRAVTAGAPPIVAPGAVYYNKLRG